MGKRPAVERCRAACSSNSSVAAGNGKPRSDGFARIGDRLVGLVAVVQPVAVDEPVLEAGQRNAAPAAFERNRPSPPARLGIGDRDLGSDRVERGRRFVHRAGRPGKLQQRDPRELLADERPAVAAVDHGMGAEFGAVPQAPARAVPIAIHRARAGERGCRRIALDRHDRRRRRERRSDPTSAARGSWCARRCRCSARRSARRSLRSRGARARCTTRRCRPRRRTARRRCERRPPLCARSRCEPARRAASRAVPRPRAPWRARPSAAEAVPCDRGHPGPLYGHLARRRRLRDRRPDGVPSTYRTASGRSRSTSASNAARCATPAGSPAPCGGTAPRTTRANRRGK